MSCIFVYMYICIFIVNFTTKGPKSVDFALLWNLKSESKFKCLDDREYH